MMTMKKSVLFRRAVLGAIVGCWLWMASVAEAAGKAPNVLFFFVDDMGIGDTRIYDDHAAVRLPNYERLAERGLVFNYAHAAAAVCAPTRYSVLSGNYPWRGRQPNGTWMAHQPSQFRPGQPSLGDLLKRVGYHTAFLGKEHLGGGLIDRNTGRIVQGWRYDVADIDFSRPMPEGLQTKGFDHVISLPQGIQGPPYAWFKNGLLVGDASEVKIWEEGQYGRSVIKRTGWGMPGFDTSEVGPMLTKAALEFLDRHYAQNEAAGEPRPFLLYYSSQSCHTPHTPPEELLGVRIDGATGHSAHLDIIYEADVTLGMLLDRIEAAGELENTLVIWTSDNGGLNWTQRQEGDTSHDSSGNLRGGKAQIWEGGHRVPFVVAWGDGSDASPIPPGRRTDALIGLQDVYATLAEMTGQSLADDEAVDSFSYYRLWRGEEDAPQRAEMLIQSNNEPEWGQDGTRAYRAGPWKLVVTRNHQPRNLFNLVDDPGERNDLIRDPEHADRIEALLEGYNNIRHSRRSVALP